MQFFLFFCLFFFLTLQENFCQTLWPMPLRWKTGYRKLMLYTSWIFWLAETIFGLALINVMNPELCLSLTTPTQSLLFWIYAFCATNTNTGPWWIDCLTQWEINVTFSERMKIKAHNQSGDRTESRVSTNLPITTWHLRYLRVFEDSLMLKDLMSHEENLWNISLPDMIS